MFDSPSVPFSARHRPRRKARGVTLIEVLIVVAILSMVSAAVGVEAWRYKLDEERRTAATSARELRQAVKGWWVVHGSDACPTVPQLVKDGVLDKDSPHKDPWGGAWRIE